MTVVDIKAQRAKYPLPWIVGPFGAIWVAADVEFRDGKWRERVSEPRLVVSFSGDQSELAQMIVDAVNAHYEATADA